MQCLYPGEIRLGVVIGDAIILDGDIFILEVRDKESPGYIVTLNSQRRKIGSSGALLCVVWLGESDRDVFTPTSHDEI